MATLDQAFGGLPFSETSSAYAGGLDFACDGLPFAPVLDDAAGTSIQAQSVAAVAHSGIAAALTPHRYWRVTIHASNGASDTNCAALELRATPGGANLATGGTASASSIYDASYPASNAFDGNASTFWNSLGPTVANQWLKYDFGSGNSHVVTEIAYRVRPDGFTTAAPRTFSVEYSDDDTSWAIAATIHEQTGWSVGEQRTFAVSGQTVPARHWRLLFLAQNGHTAASAAEIEWRASAGGADLTGSGTASASSEFSPPTYNADKAFDNNASTLWSSSGLSLHWISYDFGAGNEQTVAEMAYTCRDDMSTQAPTVALIEYSNDGTNFTAAVCITPSGWSTGETRTFTVPTTSPSVSGTGSTSQAQTAAGVAAPAADVVVATSQAQTAVGSTLEPIDVAAATSQAQSMAGVASPVLDMVSTTSQAQSAAGEAALVTPWVVVNSAIDLFDTPKSFTGNTLTLGDTSDGNSIVVFVFGYWRSDGCAIGVTDSAGNSYTSGTQFVSTGTPTVHNRTWMQAFYATNVDATTDLEIYANIGLTGTVMDNLGPLHVAAFEVDAPGLIELDVEEHKQTNVGTSGTSDAFNFSGAGAIFVAQFNSTADSIASSTTNFEADYTDLTRPGREDEPAFADATYGAAGYRVSTVALTGEQVTFTGNASSVRHLLAVGFRDGDPIVSETPASTSQAQTTAVEAAVGIDVAVATSQAQKALGFSGEVETTVATQQAQTAAAAAGVAVDAVAATSQAQSTAVEMAAVADAAALTKQAQTVAAEVGLATDCAVATGQGQSAQAQAITAVFSDVSTSQCQSVQINASTGVLASVETTQAQSASGILGAAHVMAGATQQAQSSSAVAYTAIAVAVVSKQGQTTVAAAGVGVTVTVASRQAQHVEAVARAESDQSVETKQTQTSAGALGVDSIAVTATKQGQSVSATAGTAIDATASTAQAQRMGKGLSLLHIVLDSAGSTSQAQTTAGGMPAPYIPELGELSGCVRFRSAVTGEVDAYAAVDARIETTAAVRGRSQTRPAP